MLSRKDLINYFLREAEENLNALFEGIEDLEIHGLSIPTLEAIHTASHNLKGSALFLNFNKISTLAKVLEERLEAVLNEELKLTKSQLREIHNIIRTISAFIEEVSIYGEEKSEIPERFDIEEEKKEEPIFREIMPQIDRTLSSKLPTIRIEKFQIDDIVFSIDQLILGYSSILQSLQDSKEKSWESIINFKKEIEYLREKAKSLRYPTISKTLRVLKKLGEDYALKLGKEVKINIKGRTCRIEAEQLDSIYRILSNLLLNAIIHGIEPQARRKEMGKNPQGNVEINVKQENQFLTLTLRDDGKGLNLSKIRERIIEKGLIKENEANNLSNEKLISYIFEEGISEADRFNQNIGRGFGLSIVNKIVKNLGGTIEVSSEEGKGTLFRVKIPQKPCLEDLLKIKFGNYILAVPCKNIVEIILADNSEGFIKEGHIMYANRSIPLRAYGENINYIIIFQTKESTAAIGVDRIGEFFEGIVHSFEDFIPGLEHLLGYTISEEGAPNFVLNLEKLFVTDKIVSTASTE